MNLGDWLSSEAQRFRGTNDETRVRLLSCYMEGYDVRETNPAHSYAAFSEGKRLAEQLGEPWWAMFYDSQRITALIHFQRDYRNVLELAVRCVLEVRKPTYANFPGRFSLYDGLLSVYLGIDAEGYADKIQEAIDYLEKEIPPEPDGARYLLYARKRLFAMELNDPQAAYEACREELRLAAADSDEMRAMHFAVFVYCSLCEIADLADDGETLAEWGEIGRELAEAKGHQCEMAEATAWLAVAALYAGKHDQAQTHYRNAVAQMNRLKMPGERGFFQALVRYHEMQDDLEGMLHACEQELVTLVDKGRYAPELRARLRRAQVLARLDRLTQADITTVREVALRLKRPEKYLASIDELEES